MSKTINGKTLEEIDEEVRDNMADADVGPLMKIIRGLQARVRKTHDLERAWGQERRGLLDRINELVERAAEAEAEVERLDNLLDKIKLEAQCHAQEARTQRSTVQRVIQAGKPGMGDWEDVPGMVGALKAQVEAVRSARSIRERLGWKEPSEAQQEANLDFNLNTPGEGE